MNKDTVTITSKRLSWLLRHEGASTCARDSEGFAALHDVLRTLRISQALVDAVVAQNAKKRFEIVGDRIRAVQGHSAAVVSSDAIEATWTKYLEDAPIFHGTDATAAEAILRGTEGIHAGKRSHVHLAAAVDATVGKRAAVDVLLVVDPRKVREAGICVYIAPNGVLLARTIPRAAIVDLHVSPHRRRGIERLHLLRNQYFASTLSQHTVP